MLNPIVVLGMQRSGTSALAGALARLGVYFGPEAMLYAADPNNPQGYFEHRKATLLNLRILSEFQMHVTSFTSLPENWEEFPQALALRGLLREFLEEEFRRSERWAIKQPLTSLVLPLYNAVFAEMGCSPHYVVCVRNPLETMESESKLDFQDSYRVMQPLGKMAIGSWLRYTLGSICGAAPNRVTVVPYDELLTFPRSCLAQIVAAQEGWAPSPEQWEDAVSSIRTDLRHHQQPGDALEGLPALVRDTYRSAIDLASGGKRDEAAKKLVGLNREFKTWIRMLGDPPAAQGKLGLAWLEDGAQRVAEQSFQADGRWQTVRLEIDAPPKTTVAGLVYGLPARVWIRRCVWKTADRTLEATLSCGPGSLLHRDQAMLCLDAAVEPQQIRLNTPGTAGPYEFEIELLLETGPAIYLATAERLARLLERCASDVEALSARPR